MSSMRRDVNVTSARHHYQDRTLLRMWRVQRHDTDTTPSHYNEDRALLRVWGVRGDNIHTYSIDKRYFGLRTYKPEQHHTVHLGFLDVLDKQLHTEYAMVHAERDWYLCASDQHNLVDSDRLWCERELRACWHRHIASFHSYINECLYRDTLQ